MFHRIAGWRRYAVLGALALAGLLAGAAAGAGWPQVGGDPGMDKYTSDDIAAAPLKQVYVKRFFGAWGDIGPQGNYHYASAVVVHDGVAAAFTNDARKNYQSWSDGVTLTLFDWATGKTTDKSDAPGGRALAADPLRNYSLHVGEHYGEIDSHHYSNSVCFGDDGRFYAKRGGDHFCVGSYDPATRSWGRMEVIRTSPSGKNWGGDTNAFLTIWKDLIIYRPGDTRDDSTYIATDASAGVWKSGKQGAFKSELGPYLTSPGKHNTLRYCDYPKINAAGVCVIAGQVFDNAGRPQMVLQATHLPDGKRMWTQQFDDAGRRDFGAAAPAFWWHNKTTAKWSAYYFPIGRVSDYWRFIATDNLYLLYHGAATQTLEALGINDGKVKWKIDLGMDHPVMACHGDYAYIVGNRRQMKIDVAHGGRAVWTQQHSFAGDIGYVMGGEDPVYRPMVLTDDTLWFIDGSSLSSHHRLVGMRTSDGTVVQTIDLAALVAKKAGENLLAVNDLMSSDGKLGVLLGIESKADPHANEKCNRIYCQDLYVFGK